MALAATKFMKLALIFLQVVTFLSGLIMLIAGSVIQTQITAQRLTHTISGYSTQAGSVICIVFGLLCICMSLFGLFATIKDHHRFLVIYAVIMSIVFVIQFITGVTGLSVMHNAKFNDYVKEIFQSEFNYSSSTVNESIFYQETFHCCGWNDYQDWNLTVGSPLPASCCKDKSVVCTNESPTFWGAHVGCGSKIMGAFTTVIEVVCGILVTFSLFNFASIVLAATLSKKIRTGYSYT